MHVADEEARSERHPAALVGPGRLPLRRPALDGTAVGQATTLLVEQPQPGRPAPRKVDDVGVLETHEGDHGLGVEVGPQAEPGCAHRQVGIVRQRREVRKRDAAEDVGATHHRRRRVSTGLVRTHERAGDGLALEVDDAVHRGLAARQEEQLTRGATGGDRAPVSRRADPQLRGVGVATEPERPVREAARAVAHGGRPIPALRPGFDHRPGDRTAGLEVDEPSATNRRILGDRRVDRRQLHDLLAFLQTLDRRSLRGGLRCDCDEEGEQTHRTR